MQLKRGINLGGWLSQCVHTDEHYRSFIGADDFAAIAEMGFDHVRLPVDAQVLENSGGEPVESGYAYIDAAVKSCEENGLDLIIDLHKAYGYDFNDANDPVRNNLFHVPALQTRFIGLWKRIAARYAGIPHVAFELLNEVVEQENNEAWNALIDRCVLEIRALAPDTPIIYGGIQWNSSRTLKLLRKPVTDNIIYTFHFYEPLIFTHQKAPWIADMDKERTCEYPGTMEFFRGASEKLGFQGDGAVKADAQAMGEEFITELVKEAIDAAKNAGVPLYCGEFGVIDRAPVEDTYRWFRDVDSVFRRFGIGWALWSYKKMDFGLVGEHYAPIREQLLALWNQ